jgi:hypothetical protein
MFEHVGRANLAVYFDKIAALLKPGGLVLNHGITSAALEAGGLGSGISEFIDDYVFPGGELVHASEVLRAASGSGLECLDSENLRPHYGKTLWHWVTRLEQHADEAPDRRTEIPHLAHLHGGLRLRLRPRLDGTVAGAGGQGRRRQPAELSVQAGLHVSRQLSLQRGDGDAWPAWSQ